MKTPALIMMFLVIALRAEDQPAAADLVSDVWYTVTLDSNHVGWLHESSGASTEAGQKVITTVREEAVAVPGHEKK